MDTRVKPAYDIGRLPRFTSEGEFALFFVLSKTLGIMLLPTNFLIALGLVGALLLATRFARLGRKLLIGVVVLLAICGLFAARKLAALSAGERAFRHGMPRAARRTASSCWAVRSMPIFPPRTAWRWSLRGRPPDRRGRAGPALSERADHLFRRQRQPGLGRGARKPITRRELSKASALPETRLIMERRSRNTHENAEFSKAMVSAESGRAMAVGDVRLSHAAIGRHFSQGRIRGRALSGRLAGGRTRRSPRPSSICRRLTGSQRTDIAVREWMGLVAYRLPGKTDELFPGPNSGLTRTGRGPANKPARMSARAALLRKSVPADPGSVSSCSKQQQRRRIRFGRHGGRPEQPASAEDHRDRHEDVRDASRRWRRSRRFAGRRAVHTTDQIVSMASRLGWTVGITPTIWSARNAAP